MDRDELASWIEKYGRDIYSFCMHLTKNKQEADELYQDTWLRMMEKLDQIDSEGNVKSYCLSIAHGIWRNQRRKHAWRRRIAPEVPYEPEREDGAGGESAPSPEEEALKKQLKETVWEAVDALPEKLRLVVLLYYMERLTLPQIGEVLGIPEGTAKSRLFKARKRLAEQLGEQ